MERPAAAVEDVERRDASLRNVVVWLDSLQPGANPRRRGDAPEGETEPQGVRDRPAAEAEALRRDDRRRLGDATADQPERAVTADELQLFLRKRAGDVRRRQVEHVLDAAVPEELGPDGPKVVGAVVQVGQRSAGVAVDPTGVRSGVREPRRL